MIASNIFNHRNLWITLYLICLLPVTSYRSFLEVNNYHFLDRVSPIRQFTVNINNLHRRRYTIQLASSNFEENNAPERVENPKRKSSYPMGEGIDSNGKSDANFSLSVLFTVLSAAAIAISYADRSNLSTAIIPMSQQFAWSSELSGWVLSAFWAGYALTQVFGGKLSDRFGGEKLLVVALLLWSACTALTPAAAEFGTAPLLAIRVALGAGEGLALPSIYSMLQKYVPSAQQATSVSAITAACYLGSLLSNAAAPSIIDQLGWPACFYIFACLPTVLWLPLWTRSFISPAAPGLDRSQEKMTEMSIAGRPSWKEEVYVVRQLLSSGPVWAIVAAQYGQSWGMIGLLSWLPTYYSERFDVPLSALSSFTALPYLLQLGAALGAGVLADKLISAGVRVLTVRRTIQTVGMVVPAVLLSYCSLSGAQLSATETSLLIAAGSAVGAITSAAVSCNQFDIAPKYAGTVFGIGNTFSCLAGFIAVPVSGWLFHSTGSWDAVFLLFAAHYLLGAAAFYALSSDRPIDIDIEIDSGSGIS